MTSPNSAIDPAFAAALDRFDVPPVSAAFGDSIVAAALTGRRRAGLGWRLRERHRPWTRRALAGSVALALCTTAVAAALLDHVGVRLPAMPAFLAPAPIPTAPHIAVRKPARAPNADPKHHASIATVSDKRSDVVIEMAAAPLPLTRREVIRERLNTLPPGERREVVRRVIGRAIIARVIANRVTADSGQRRAIGGAATSLAERPGLRAALVERIRARRERRDVAPVVISNGVADATLWPRSALRTLEPLPSLVRPDASVGAILPVLNSQVPRIERADGAERAERLARLRQVRALRQQLRRQRRP